MKLTLKSILLAATLVMPALFSGNALATSESCGTCTVGNAPNTSVHTGVNAAMMACSSCHTRRAIPATPATPAMPATGTMVIRRTSESCGTCAVGTAPATSAHKNVTATTVCSVCHVSGSTGSTTVKVRPTSLSCGDCLVDTAPSSVSAHKNVNTTHTVCAACHGITAGTGNSTGGTGHSDDHHGEAGGRHDDKQHQTSPGNSEFGRSHKKNNGQHRGRDD